MSGLIAGLVLLAVAALAVTGLAWQSQRRLAAVEAGAARQRERLDGIELLLAESPSAGIVWEHGEARLIGDVARLLGSTDRIAGLDVLLGRLADADRSAVVDAVAALREHDREFTLEAGLKGTERRLRWLGRRGSTAAIRHLVWLQDDGDRGQRAQRLERERDRLAALLDSLALPIWSRNAELAIDYCNSAYAAAVGLPRDQVLSGQLELSGAAGGSRALARRAIKLATPQAESQPLVIAGDRRLYEFIERPVQDGGTAGQATDVTALEHTQAELAANIAAQSEVLEHLATGIVIYGADARVKFYNRAYAELFGLTEEFLRGQPTMAEELEALRERRRVPEHPDFPAFKRDTVRRLMGVITPSEELIHEPDGSTLRRLAAPHPFGGVLILYEDVTDRLALERSYNTLIDVQRATLDNLYEAVAVYGSDGRLKLSNPAFAELCGLDGALLAGEPHIRRIVDAAPDLFGPEADQPVQRERLVADITEGRLRSGRVERADGSILDVGSVPLPDGAMLFTYLDVTDRTRVERALRERNAALETADRLKSEFIANVSYELRTPLNAIIGFAEILDLRYFGPLNERQREYSRGIVDASQRLLALINDILDIATIEAGYLQLELAPVPIRPFLLNLQAMAAGTARSRNLTVAVECPADIGALNADPRRLKQALYNLVSNALKFTPPGGRITLSAARADDTVRLAVADNGIGIAPEHQARVFEKFARVDLGRREGGVGLGLSLVKSLVELHGGTVELESAPETGTRITCRLPATPGLSAASADAAALADGGMPDALRA
jgi:signal transduction histidine kinase